LKSLIVEGTTKFRYGDLKKWLAKGQIKIKKNIILLNTKWVDEILLEE